MSHFIVMPIRPTASPTVNGSHTIVDKVAKECIKEYWTEKGQANAHAQQLARKYPMVQFAVFEPVSIYETAEPKVIQKRMTESGEIVLAKEE